MECWFNEAPQAVAAYFIGINTIAAGANVLLVRKDAVIVGATTYTFSSAFDTGQWNHFAMTYSGTVLKVYKNGQAVLTQTVSMPSALYLSNFGIATEFDAADGGTPGDYYTGYIHDFRVVNSVVYTENFTPPTELLEDIAGTTLLCLRNNTFTDDSANKTLITRFNNPLTENISPYAVDEFVSVTRTSAVLNPAFGSVIFNGSTDGINVASNFTLGTGDFTIEFWCNFTQIVGVGGALRRILNQGANADGRVQVYILAANTAINNVTAIRGSITLAVNITTFISTVIAVNDGKWHHIAFTRSSGTLRSFVDGVLMDTRTGFTTNLFSPLGYRIGTYSTATDGNYAGSLANIRISAPKAWYTENFTPPQDNFFVDYLDFGFTTEVKLLIQGPELFDISNNFYTTVPFGTVATFEDSPFLQTAVTVFAPVKRAIKSYGNRGGNTITGTTQLGGGGGGGAAAPGANTNTAIGGVGGNGIFATAFDAYYSGGGGGGNTTDITTEVAGGIGGGGAGGGSSLFGYHNATANTGGGGGGGYSIALPTFYAGGNGGSGIVKIKYKSNRPTAVKNGDMISPIYNEISDSIPISAIGPAASYTYFIDPQLPTGLTFDSATGAINGTSLSTIDAVFTVTVADTGSPSLRDSATFRLTITGTLTAVGGQQLTIIEEDQVYQVHKLTQSDFITVDNLGTIEYYIIGGGGAGGGGAGTLDGDGGGGAGGYMVGIKNITSDEFISTVVYADSDFQDQGWTEDSDFTGTTGVIEFEKTITSSGNQVFAGGARSNTISQSIKSYLEIKINDYANVNVGLCRSSSAGGFANVTSINLDTGAVGYQQLEFKDNSVNNSKITKNGDTTFSEIAPLLESAGWSGFFDGTGDYLTVLNNNAFDFGADNFTIECWIYLTSTINDRGIYGKRADTNTSPLLFGIREVSGTNRLFLWGSTSAGTWNINGSFTPGTIAIPINTWTHVACVRDNTTFTTFVNGVSDTVISGISDSLQVTTAAVSIGATNASGNNPFLGHISNARIVKGTALYTANFTPPTDPLISVAGTSLLTLQDNEFVDRSANNFAITRVGDTRITLFSPFPPAFLYSSNDRRGSAFFDGTGDYLNGTFTAPRTGDFTVEAWVNVSNRSVGRCIFTSRSGDTSDGFQVIVDSGGEVRVGFTGTNFINSALNTVVVNKWYHIAVTRLSSTMTLWINGVNSGTSVRSNDFTNSTFRIGLTPENNFPMFGYISNLRFVTGTAVYTTNFTPPTESLTAVTGTSLLTLQGPNFVPTSERLSAFRSSDILQILYDGLNNKVYFGKNNAWSKNYLSPADGDVIPDSGPLQVIIMTNGPVDSTAIMSAVFLKKENYIYAPPAGYTALGDEIAIFPVVIGAGGAGSTSTSGGNGGDTILFGVTALGGGGGAAFDLVGKAGGSGGGAGGRNTRAGGAALQLALGGFGSVGGTSSPTSATGSNAGGGGGGIPQINITRASGTLVGIGGAILDFEQDGVFYRTHVFNSTSTFYVNSDRDIDYLVVAGGGGGGYGRTGNHTGGGGGAGGLLYSTSRVVVGTTYVITVGAGGAAFTNGTNSSIIGDVLSVTATGGGHGGGGGGADGFIGGIGPTPGANGGSGGGGSANHAGGLGIPGQGNNGADGNSTLTFGGGGGGGAGAQGIQRESGGGGGIGRQFDITGADTYYAGGGGYGANSPGGLGGGGKGGKDLGTTDPADLAASGEANTGGGGGGGAPPNSKVGGSGGSGVVVIRYQISAAEKLNNTDYISAGILTSSPGQNAALAAGGAGGTGITLFDGEIYGSGGGASGQTTSGLGGSIYAGEGARSAGLVGASSGLANTGSGGGGSWGSTTNGGLGGAGGSGVAFIRYRTQ